MRLSEIIPDGETLLSLEAEELGIRLLPILQKMQRSYNGYITSLAFVEDIIGARGHPNYQNQYPDINQNDLKRALYEAFAWLESETLLYQFDPGNSTYRKLSRKAEKIVADGDFKNYKIVKSLPREMLHNRIAAQVWNEFIRGQYDAAVFLAMKAVEVSVREAAGLEDDIIGVSLMTTAFKEKGPLTDPKMNKAEQVARMNLFAGAIGSYKNPHSHRDVNMDDPAEAMEIVLLANHLLKIVDARRVVKQEI